jgi:N-acetylglucosaminyl-diphospho-decaprenol L-rhamnosyltransferase
MSRFDVVIVAYGNRDGVERCVKVARELPDVGEVIVVDHGSDGAGDAARCAGAQVLVDARNPGFGAGQNRGVAHTTAPFVLLLNPDAEPDPDGVARGLQALVEQPDVGAVQGIIMNRDTGRPERSQGRELGPLHLLGRAMGARRLLQWRGVRAVARRLTTFQDHVDREPAGPTVVDSLAATAVLVRRKAFDAVGGFDESYFLYGEDLDLCRRLRAGGWTLLALPFRFALHEGGSSSSNRVERELSWWRGTMRFAARWWSTAAWSAALGAATMEWACLTARQPKIARRAWRSLVSGPCRDRLSRPEIR